MTTNAEHLNRLLAQMVEGQKNTDKKLDKVLTDVHEVQVKFARFEGANFMGEIDKLSTTVKSLSDKVESVEKEQISRQYVFVILGVLGTGMAGLLFWIARYAIQTSIGG